MKLIKLCGIVFLHLLVLVQRSLADCNGHQAEITLSPVSQNTTDGSPASFVCGGTGNIVSWSVNNVALNASYAIQLGVSHQTNTSDPCTIVSNITFNGSAKINNSAIHCVITSGGFNTVQSAAVFLGVQGPPTTVNDINIIHNGTSGHLLSWSAPYSLQGIDTFYYLSVIDESNGGETIVTTVYNTSYDKLELIACHNYMFSIIPSNNAGNGSESKLVYFYPGAPVSPLADNISINSLAFSTHSGLVTVILQYPITSQCYSHQNITVIASNDGSVLSTVSQVDDSMVSVAIDGLPLNKVLSLYLVLSNEFGSISTSNGVMIRTYNIQGVTLLSNDKNGTSCFQCIFLPNSNISGCLLNLIPINSSLGSCSMSRNISLSKTNCSLSEMCLDNLYNGGYTIEIYDMYNATNDTALSYSDQPQVLTNIDIDGVQCINNSSVVTVTSTIYETSSTATPTRSDKAFETNVGSIRNIGVFVGIFGGVLIIIIVVMTIIFIYRKRQMKGGHHFSCNNADHSVYSGHSNTRSLRINQSTDSGDDPNLTRVSTIQSIDISQMASFSSIEPPPYNPPPQITRDDLDHHPTEQYIIMHSASTRSPSVSNSTSSHLGLVQGNTSSPSHKEFLITSGHYDHLQQTDEDLPKKHPLDHLLRASNDRYSFELKPFYRNEHLV